MKHPNNNAARRRGVGAFEVMLILPVILLMLLAGVQFSMMLTAEDKVAESSRQAARAAAASGDKAAIHGAVKNCLGSEVYSKATIAIKYLDTDEASSFTGQSVQVTVSVPCKEMAPNYLKLIGVDNSDEAFVGRTTMRMESVR
jgi:Flp pilus assembly protein TadG